MSILDLYKSLFGRKGINDGDVINMSEHGRVGGVSTGQPFKFVSIVDQTTGQPNPLPTGASTSANQTNGTQKTQLVDSTNVEIKPNLEATQLQIQSLLETSIAYLNMLSSLAGVKGTAQDIRATILSGTVSTVSTVSTVTSLNQFGGLSNTPVTPNLQNLVAINSNVNNVATV